MVPSRGAWKSRGPHFALRAPYGRLVIGFVDMAHRRLPWEWRALKRPATAPQALSAATAGTPGAGSMAKSGGAGARKVDLRDGFEQGHPVENLSEELKR